MNSTAGENVLYCMQWTENKKSLAIAESVSKCWGQNYVQWDVEDHT